MSEQTPATATPATATAARSALIAGRFADAQVIARHLLLAHPDDFDLLSIAGVAALNLNRPGDAQKDFEFAARLRPDVAAAQVNLAETYRRLGRSRDAAARFRAAVAIDPASIDFQNRLGELLMQLRDYDGAVECIRKITWTHRTDDTLTSLAFALRKAGRAAEAVAVARQALTLAPRKSSVATELICSLLANRQDHEAKQRIAQNAQQPIESAAAQLMLGSMLERVGRFTDAADAYELAAGGMARPLEAFISAAGMLNRAGDWNRLDALLKHAVEKLPNDSTLQSMAIFTALYSPAATDESIAVEHRRWWKNFGEQRFRESDHQFQNDANPNRPLRIGYVSPDFREHPITFFIEPILRAHRAEEAQVFCYSGVRRPDDVTTRLRSFPIQWRDIAELDDRKLDELIRADRIDILVDVTQHLADNRMTLFARKAAPMQVAYLAYPYSSGLESIDYRLSDSHLDPLDAIPAGPEKIVRLPESYFCYRAIDHAPAIEPAIESASEPGTVPSQRAGFITFGSMNQLIKMNEMVYDAWARVLSAIATSRLFAKAQAFEDPVARKKFADEFARRGVNPQRIEMQGISLLPEALAEFSRRADVMLDTFPYPGGTTSCHLLWTGLPVVTVAGNLPIHRMGVSLLANVGLDDLVARDADDFVRIAVEIACDEARRSSLRQTLRQTMRTSPLMDAQRFTANLESIYREMWRTWCAGK